jgi:hypothetical protein
MAFALLDLSVVTQRLVDLLIEARDFGPVITPNPFNLDVSGKPPDEARTGNITHLSLYLFHVAADKQHRNTGWVSPPSFPPSPPAPPFPRPPIGLDLSYLLSVSSAGSITEEQRALSMALRCFHEHPVVKITDAANNELARFTVTLEPNTSEEIGRLWQAAAVSMRVAAVYRVAVVFLQEPEPPATAPPVAAFSLSVNPTPPAGSTPFLAGTVTTFTPVAPGMVAANVKPVDLFPARVGPGQAFVLYGAGFDLPSATNTYLLTPGGVEEDVSAWVQAVGRGAGRRPLRVPPADSHPAGPYLLRLGNNKPPGDPAASRSASTPFAIAPSVDPGGGPLLPAPVPGTPYVLAGAGFLAGSTEVDLETVTLTLRTAPGNPAAGEFTLAGTNTVRFLPPPGLAAGLYAVRVRVNQMEALPSRWVQLP